MSATEEDIRARLAAASPAPWHFATAPHDPEKETKEEYVTGALNKWIPDAVLWTCWAADPDGGPDDYIIPALTGDGPTSYANAVFIANAPTDIAHLLTRVDELQSEVNALRRTLDVYEGQE